MSWSHQRPTKLVGDGGTAAGGGNRTARMRSPHTSRIHSNTMTTPPTMSSGVSPTRTHSSHGGRRPPSSERSSTVLRSNSKGRNSAVGTHKHETNEHSSQSVPSYMSSTASRSRHTPNGVTTPSVAVAPLSAIGASSSTGGSFASTWSGGGSGSSSKYHDTPSSASPYSPSSNHHRPKHSSNSSYNIPAVDGDTELDTRWSPSNSPPEVHLAATLIQSAWRGYLCRRAFRKKRDRIERERRLTTIETSVRVHDTMLEAQSYQLSQIDQRLKESSLHHHSDSQRFKSFSQHVEQHASRLRDHTSLLSRSEGRLTNLSQRQNLQDQALRVMWEELKHLRIDMSSLKQDYTKVKKENTQLTLELQKQKKRQAKMMDKLVAVTAAAEASQTTTTTMTSTVAPLSPSVDSLHPSVSSPLVDSSHPPDVVDPASSGLGVFLSTLNAKELSDLVRIQLKQAMQDVSTTTTTKKKKENEKKEDEHEEEEEDGTRSIQRRRMIETPHFETPQQHTPISNTDTIHHNGNPALISTVSAIPPSIESHLIRWFLTHSSHPFLDSMSHRRLLAVCNSHLSNNDDAVPPSLSSDVLESWFRHGRIGVYRFGSSAASSTYSSSSSSTTATSVWPSNLWSSDVREEILEEERMGHNNQQFYEDGQVERIGRRIQKEYEKQQLQQQQQPKEKSASIIVQKESISSSPLPSITSPVIVPPVTAASVPASTSSSSPMVRPNPVSSSSSLSPHSTQAELLRSLLLNGGSIVGGVGVGVDGSNDAFLETLLGPESHKDDTSSRSEFEHHHHDDHDDSDGVDDYGDDASEGGFDSRQQSRRWSVAQLGRGSEIGFGGGFGSEFEYHSNVTSRRCSWVRDHEQHDQISLSHHQQHHSHNGIEGIEFGFSETESEMEEEEKYDDDDSSQLTRTFDRSYDASSPPHTHNTTHTTTHTTLLPAATIVPSSLSSMVTPTVPITPIRPRRNRASMINTNASRDDESNHDNHNDGDGDDDDDDEHNDSDASSQLSPTVEPNIPPPSDLSDVARTAWKHAARSQPALASSPSPPPSLPPASSSSTDRPPFPTHQTLYSFTASQPGQVSFERNELILVLSKEPLGWWRIRNAEGSEGMAPMNRIGTEVKQQQQQQQHKQHDPESTVSQSHEHAAAPISSSTLVVSDTTHADSVSGSSSTIISHTSPAADRNPPSQAAERPRVAMVAPSAAGQVNARAVAASSSVSSPTSSMAASAYEPISESLDLDLDFSDTPLASRSPTRSRSHSLDVSNESVAKQNNEIEMQWENESHANYEKDDDPIDNDDVDDDDVDADAAAEHAIVAHWSAIAAKEAARAAEEAEEAKAKEEEEAKKIRDMKSKLAIEAAAAAAARSMPLAPPTADLNDGRDVISAPDAMSESDAVLSSVPLDDESLFAREQSERQRILFEESKAHEEAELQLQLDREKEAYARQAVAAAAAELQRKLDESEARLRAFEEAKAKEEAERKEREEEAAAAAAAEVAEVASSIVNSPPIVETQFEFAPPAPAAALAGALPTPDVPPSSIDPPAPSGTSLTSLAFDLDLDLGSESDFELELEDTTNHNNNNNNNNTHIIESQQHPNNDDMQQQQPAPPASSPPTPPPAMNESTPLTDDTMVGDDLPPPPLPSIEADVTAVEESLREDIDLSLDVSSIAVGAPLLESIQPLPSPPSEPADVDTSLSQPPVEPTLIASEASNEPPPDDAREDDVQPPASVTSTISPPLRPPTPLPNPDITSEVILSSPLKFSKLIVEVLEARDLSLVPPLSSASATDSSVSDDVTSSLPNPYVVLVFQTSRGETEYVCSTRAPCWETAFCFEVDETILNKTESSTSGGGVDEITHDHIALTICSKDLNSSSASASSSDVIDHSIVLGSFVLPISQLIDQHFQTCWLPLQGRMVGPGGDGSKVKGELRVGMVWLHSLQTMIEETRLITSEEMREESILTRHLSSFEWNKLFVSDFYGLNLYDSLDRPSRENPSHTGFFFTCQFQDEQQHQVRSTEEGCLTTADRTSDIRFEATFVWDVEGEPIELARATQRQHQHASSSVRGGVSPDTLDMRIQLHKRSAGYGGSKSTVDATSPRATRPSRVIGEVTLSCDRFIDQQTRTVTCILKQPETGTPIGSVRFSVLWLHDLPAFLRHATATPAATS